MVVTHRRDANAYSSNVKDRDGICEAILSAPCSWLVSFSQRESQQVRQSLVGEKRREVCVQSAAGLVGLAGGSNEGHCTSAAGCLLGAIVSVDACHCVTGRVRRRGLPASPLCCGSEDSTFALRLLFVRGSPTCQTIIMSVVGYIIRACLHVWRS